MHYLHTRTPKIIHRGKLLLFCFALTPYLRGPCSTDAYDADLKTENIFIDKDWSAKIGDFGLAKLKISQQIRRERSRAGLLSCQHYRSICMWLQSPFFLLIDR
jgi:hypothetical protein